MKEMVLFAVIAMVSVSTGITKYDHKGGDAYALGKHSGMGEKQ